MKPALVRGAVLCVLLGVISACGDDDDGGDKSDGGTAGKGGSTSGSGGSTSGSGGSSGSGSTIKPLGDNVAGRACTSATDCGGAMCATSVPGAAVLPATAPGGYCTGDCLTDADCGAGGKCSGALQGIANGRCFASCTADSDCREGYSCSTGLLGFDMTKTCRPKPMTDMLENGTAGQACEADTDCPGGMCLLNRPNLMSLAGMGTGTPLPGGYCTGDCTDNTQCGSEGVCSPPLADGLTGSCYQECSSDDDCRRDGYRCRVVGQNVKGCDAFPDPLPDNQAGKACSSDADCGGVMNTCASTLPGANGPIGQPVSAPGNYCTQRCSDDADCGAGGVCITALGGLLDGACFKPCDDASDCRSGYTCDARGGAFMIPGQPAAPTDAGMPTGQTVCTPQSTTPDNDAG